MEKVCKKLRFDYRWGVSEPDGRNGGLLVAWTDKVEVLHMPKYVFCMELEVRVAYEESSFWVIFGHASVEGRERP